LAALDSNFPTAVQLGGVKVGACDTLANDLGNVKVGASRRGNFLVEKICVLFFANVICWFINISKKYFGMFSRLFFSLTDLS